MNYYCQWKGCEKFIIDNFSHSIANFSRKSMCLCVCVREYFYDDYPIRKITAINLTLYVKWVGFRKNIGAQPFVLYMMLNSQAEKFVLFNTTLDSRYPVFQKSILLSIIVDIESNTPFNYLILFFELSDASKHALSLSWRLLPHRLKFFPAHILWSENWKKSLVTRSGGIQCNLKSNPCNFAIGFIASISFSKSSTFSWKK